MTSIRTESWEQKFDEEFPRLLKGSKQFSELEGHRVKRFIRVLFHSLREQMEGMKKKVDERPEKVGYTAMDYQTDAYNAAIQDCLAILDAALEGTQKHVILDTALGEKKVCQQCKNGCMIATDGNGNGSCHCACHLQASDTKE